MPHSQQEIAYALAYILVLLIEDGLETGLTHYRNKQTGKLLTTLNQVVNAIINNNLKIGAKK